MFGSSFRDSVWKLDIHCISYDCHFIMEKSSQDTDNLIIQDNQRSLIRQTILAFLINSVAFLQGASVPCSTIILTKLQKNDTSNHSQGDFGMFHDFHITEEEGSWIGSAKNIIAKIDCKS